MEDSKKFIKAKITVAPQVAQVLAFIQEHVEDGWRTRVAEWVGQLGPIYFQSEKPLMNMHRVSGPFSRALSETDDAALSFKEVRARKPDAT
ncbi:hypothetical protein [Acetobacter cerevisiae]|uniref:hypothetical protein n=1 Tax=Acetobacter cerevisiae TaxID=178900 RepID=UPI00209E9F43|nr:hypothetical protein [Acetobacter cerevisiae]MCP1270570.1 hypothetical protein [Acetobacter cerevisiae]MCP1278524.1 hypothetical protein [Acetobacter cerevisiae]